MRRSCNCQSPRSEPSRKLAAAGHRGYPRAMSRGQPSFTCSDCGAVHRKWAGRCDACGAWNSIVEEAPLSTGPKALGAKGKTVPLTDLATEEAPPPRAASGMDELDRVLGGGLVPASAILVGGDPGIGKSTLLLQATASFARRGLKCLYISGEEAAAQVRMRAQRLGLSDAPVALGAETALRDILTTLDAERPHLAVIDSIQTMWLDTVEAAPGSVSQVRAAAHELVTFAKRRGVAVILVGHVTKEGQIAGPRVVEHMVDTVLYFEGERGHQFRILRAVKNRFGPADEIGVFEMTGAGLVPGIDPGLKRVALGQQLAVARGEAREDPGDALPEGGGIEPGSGKGARVDELGEFARNLQTGLVDHFTHRFNSSFRPAALPGRDRPLG